VSGAGTPTVLDAVIFDLDGVLTDTAAIHFRAWKETFDTLLAGAEAGDGGGGEGPSGRFERFTEDDYLSFVDGKPRDDGVASFLASRGLELPRGTPEDPPGHTSAWAVGNRKNRRFHEILERDGIRAYGGSLRLLGQLEAAGVPVAVASSSRNARRVLAAAGLARRVEVVVDGVDAARRGLAGKPAPDVFLAAARELGAAAERTAVVEDALSGVQAAAAGGFGLVLGIARHGDPEELAAAGADRVAADLGEIDLSDLERWFREELAEDGWKIRQHRFDPERERTW
jgi:beta-phosphoglucomutase family hydrolase